MGGFLFCTVIMIQLQNENCIIAPRRIRKPN